MKAIVIGKAYRRDAILQATGLSGVRYRNASTALFQAGLLSVKNENSLWGAEGTQTLNQIKQNWTGQGVISFNNSFGDNVSVVAVIINPTLSNSLFEPVT